MLSIDSSTYINEGTATVGRFVIHFESNTNEADYMSSSDLGQVIQYIRNIDKVFFTDFGFKDPAYEKGETKCHIYIVFLYNLCIEFQKYKHQGGYCSCKQY